MGEYEPDDSRDVTLSDHRAPGEPPRTGPREAEARAKAQPAQKPQPTQKQGVADPEPRDKPTARDALGRKEPGFAADDEESKAKADDDSVPLGK